jgi:hypothetical protein
MFPTFLTASMAFHVVESTLVSRALIAESRPQYGQV